MYRPFLIIIFSILAYFPAVCQEIDSFDFEDTRMEVEQFDSQAFEKYLNDPNFEYGIVKSKKGFSIKEWLKNKWNELIGGSKTSFRKLILRIVFYGLMFFAVVALLVHFIKGKESRILLKSDQSVLSNKLLGNNNSHQSLEEQLRQYKVQEKWNLAVRAVYLLSLGKLASADYFQLKASKTNLKYLREIKDNNVRQIFKDIVDLFELDWYGGFEITSQEFNYLESKYKELIKNLSITESVK